MRGSIQITVFIINTFKMGPMKGVLVVSVVPPEQMQSVRCPYGSAAAAVAPRGGEEGMDRWHTSRARASLKGKNKGDCREWGLVRKYRVSYLLATREEREGVFLRKMGTEVKEIQICFLEVLWRNIVLKLFSSSSSKILNVWVAQKFAKFKSL